MYPRVLTLSNEAYIKIQTPNSEQRKSVTETQQVNFSCINAYLMLPDEFVCRLLVLLQISSRAIISFLLKWTNITVEI